MTLSVLVNPRARGARRDPALPARLAAIARGLGEVIVTDPLALPALADELAARGVPLLAICGGDGTGQTVLTAVCAAYARAGRAPPRFSLLRGGTVNTVTRNLGLRGTPEALLARLCQRLRDGGPIPCVSQQLLSVNDRLGFLFGAAMGARFLELFYERPTPSTGDAARLALSVIGSALSGGELAQRVFRPTGVSLRCDGGAALRLDEARLIVAATVPDMGLGMRICPRARDLPGHFQLVASGLAPPALAHQVAAVQAGRALEGAPHVDRVVADAELSFDEDSPYTVDGDLFRARSIRLRAAARIELVRP